MDSTEHYIGIDPGSKGAMAVIDKNDNVLWIEDIDKDFSTYWYPTTYLMVDYYTNYVCVEDVCGRPGQSVQANTTFMKLAGVAEYVGWLLSDNGKFYKVKPQTWKKHFGLITTGLTKTEKKHLSIDLAKELFPSVADKLTASKDGRAEALLLAKYCKDVCSVKE